MLTPGYQADEADHNDHDAMVTWNETAITDDKKSWA